jgi:hypothetical protein
LIGIGVATVLVILILSIRSQDRDVEVRKSSAPARKRKPKPEWTRGPLDEAAELAKQGQYAEAIRVLLGGSFEGLHRGQDVSIDRCFTSREILARARLEGDQRSALQKLVGAVERSLFAGRGAGAEDYSTCVESYQSLLASQGQGASG